MLALTLSAYFPIARVAFVVVEAASRVSVVVTRAARSGVGKHLLLPAKYKALRGERQLEERTYFS